MRSFRSTAVLLGSVAAATLGALAADTAVQSKDTYDELPEGAPAEIAGWFYSALDVPNVADWPPEDKQALLEVVAVRYRNRRNAAVASDWPQRYVEHLAQSPLARQHPSVVRQTCAQYGLTNGICTQHRSYVRRALVVEEMLAQRHLSLKQLEAELGDAQR